MPQGANRRMLAGLLVALSALLVFLQYRLWFGAGGYRSVEVLDLQVQSQVRENAGLRERNDALAAEVQNLKSGEAAVEERARSELGMIRPGETFYRVVESGSAPTASVDPSTRTAPDAPVAAPPQP